MRRLYAACGILLLLLGLSLANGRYARRISCQAAEELERAQALAAAEDWEQAQSVTEDAFQRWQGSSFYLHTVIRHEDTDQILRTFCQVRQYLSDRDWGQYAAANADLIVQLGLLSEKEEAALDNVL